MKTVNEIIDHLEPEEMNADERKEMALDWLRDNAPIYVLQYLDNLEFGEARCKCGWSGSDDDAIYAGLNSLLCPNCEDVLKAND